MANDMQQLILKIAGTEARAAELKRMARFVAVGVLNTIVGYGAFFILSYYLYYLLALVISHIIGVANSYVWNKYWTFGTSKLRAGEILRFSSVYLFTLVMNMVILGFAVDYAHLDPRIGQLIALPLATLASYFGHKYWSFRSK